MDERTMDVIEKFGNRVSSQALKDPEKARRLLRCAELLDPESSSDLLSPQSGHKNRDDPFIL